MFFLMYAKENHVDSFANCTFCIRIPYQIDCVLSGTRNCALNYGNTDGYAFDGFLDQKSHPYKCMCAEFFSGYAYHLIYVRECMIMTHFFLWSLLHESQKNVISFLMCDRSEFEAL